MAVPPASRVVHRRSVFDYMLRYTGPWNGTTLYVVGDVVTSGGYNYYCTATNNNVLPPNVAYWNALGYSAADTWHYVGDATTGLGTTFATGASNYGSGYQSVAFKQENGNVRFGGLCSCGGSWTSSNPLFTLPSGYRPTSNAVLIGAPASYATGYGSSALTISTAGVLNLYTNSASTNWVAFDGLSFAIK